MSISCSKKPEWWLCSLCIVMSGPHTRNHVGTVRSYHVVVTFQYHGFGNSGGSSNAIANGMVPDKALVPQVTWPTRYCRSLLQIWCLFPCCLFLGGGRLTRVYYIRLLIFFLTVADPHDVRSYPKADTCSALTHVRFVPIADIEPFHSSNLSARSTISCRGGSCSGLPKKPLLQDFGIFRMPLMVGKNIPKSSHALETG